MSEIAAKIAKDCHVSLDFQATDKNVANWYFCGPALKQIERLQDAGNVKAFIDDDVLYVKDRDKALSGKLRILSQKTGMIGIPKATEKGLEVSYLIDGESCLGGMLRLNSKFNPSLNGDYIIEQLKFDIASHEDAFFIRQPANGPDDTGKAMNKPNSDMASEGSLARQFAAAFRSLLMNIDDMLPATVVSYDDTSNRAVVKPLVMMVTTAGKKVGRGALANIPVFRFGGGGFFIRMPVKPGISAG